jgi:hypothetical protein
VELGAFQATSLFARWVGERIHGGDSGDASRRAFQAVEDLITFRDVELGDELAAEFIEALWNAPDAHALMGPGHASARRQAGSPAVSGAQRLLRFGRRAPR